VLTDNRNATRLDLPHKLAQSGPNADIGSPQPHLSDPLVVNFPGIISVVGLKAEVIRPRCPMKGNLLLKELENIVSMESLTIQFQIGRGLLHGAVIT
jgi:hypothetical protein